MSMTTKCESAGRDEGGGGKQAAAIKKKAKEEETQSGGCIGTSDLSMRLDGSSIH